MDMSALIVAICVVIPAVIAFMVCGIIFCSHRKKSLSYQYQNRRPQDNYIHDFRRSYQFEPPPPSYETSSIHQTRRQPLPLFTPIRTIPARIHINHDSPPPPPSAYAAKPPSYAEIFLTPNT